MEKRDDSPRPQFFPTLDRMPGWKVVRFMMPAFATACVLIAIAPNIAVLTLSIHLLRLFGQGMMTETACTEIGRWFVADRGRFFSESILSTEDFFVSQRTMKG